MDVVTEEPKNHHFAGQDVGDPLKENEIETRIDVKDETNENQNSHEGVYRQGNFGQTLGFVNKENGLMWIRIHGVLMLLFLVLNIIGFQMLKLYFGMTILSKMAIGSTLTMLILGCFLAGFGLYFFNRLRTLQRPYALLMTVRFLATFTCINALFSLCFVSLNLLATKGFLASIEEVNVGKMVLAFMLIIVVIEIFVTPVFVCKPACGTCSKNFCIYFESEGIAPGVANPPSQEKWEVAAHVARSVAGNLEKYDD